MASDPIIIWTFRRTGGTSLKSILFHLSGNATFEDEALNDDPPRELGSITAKFRQDGDKESLLRSLQEVLTSKKNLKHCCDTVPFELSFSLFKASRAAGYRHIVLLRLDEVRRLISLEIARVSGAWGPDEAKEIVGAIEAGSFPPIFLDIPALRHQAMQDAVTLGQLLRMFYAGKEEFVLTYFEDLYLGGSAARCAEFRRVAAGVGIPDASALADGVFMAAATANAQDTAAIARHVSNLDVAHAALKDVIFVPWDIGGVAL